MLLEFAPHIKDTLESKYGMRVDGDDERQLSSLLVAMQRIPQALTKATGVLNIGFKDLGVSKEYYPNHGVYVDNKLYLNTQLLDDEQVYLDNSGRSLNRFEHTLYHEMGHGYDDVMGNLSMQSSWLRLSGWNEKPLPGLCRVTIKEEGTPDVVGEWCYSPSAGFPRFYAKRNPWDDFADCFAFYVAGLTGFLPHSKINYFDAAIGQYWMS